MRGLPSDPGLHPLIMRPLGWHTDRHIDICVHLKIFVKIVSLDLVSWYFGWFFLQRLILKFPNSLADPGGKERCRFWGCRRCTLGALSFGLSLSPKKSGWFLLITMMILIMISGPNLKIPNNSEHIKASVWQCCQYQLFQQYCLTILSISIVPTILFDNIVNINCSDNIVR